MPPGREAAGSEGLAATSGAHRFSELSNKALQRILSFLPSGEAVQMSLLSRQWLDMWKDARSLRITNPGAYPSANELNFFVNMFLLFSNPQPLHVVEISNYPCRSDGDAEESLRYLELWVRNCVQRKAQILKVHNKTENVHWQLDLGLLSSEHLRVVELSHVKINGVLNNSRIRCLDFSCCPALEDLVMNNCDIEAATLIVSPSLKRLTLKCCSLSYEARARISVPELLFLILASCEGRTPILEKMPRLVSGFVRLQADMDFCKKNYETGGCNSCPGCHHCIIGRNASVLLESLSGAAHLELTSMQTEFIFRKDLTQCPIFSMLKTLLLNEWCVTTSLDALRCLLQHCPILEKLTIQFPKAHVCSDNILEELIDDGAIYNMATEPIQLKHLKVEVICPLEVEIAISISKILGLLHSFGVPPGQIMIQQPPLLIDSDSDSDSEYMYEDVQDYNDKSKPWPSARFSFEMPELDN